MTVSAQASDKNWNLLFIAWLMAAAGTMGSLFFSEVMGFAPCVLCWWQRVFLYPLVITLGLGLFPLDKGSVRYSLPLAVAGWLVALYHNLLYHGIIPESLEPCSQGVSCTETYIKLLGFLTIPMLSLILFTLIAALLLVLKRRMDK